MPFVYTSPSTVSWAEPVKFVAQLCVLSVSSAGVWRWLPTIDVAVALIGIVKPPPKTCMNASGRLWDVV